MFGVFMGFYFFFLFLLFFVYWFIRSNGDFYLHVGMLACVSKSPNGVMPKAKSGERFYSERDLIADGQSLKGEVLLQDYLDRERK